MHLRIYYANQHCLICGNNQIILLQKGWGKSRNVWMARLTGTQNIQKRWGDNNSKKDKWHVSAHAGILIAGLNMRWGLSIPLLVMFPIQGKPTRLIERFLISLEETNKKNGFLWHLSFLISESLSLYLVNWHTQYKLNRWNTWSHSPPIFISPLFPLKRRSHLYQMFHFS